MLALAFALCCTQMPLDSQKPLANEQLLRGVTALLHNAELDVAAGLLQLVPNSSRGWEWHYLESQLLRAEALTEVERLAVDPAGTVLVIAKQRSVATLVTATGVLAARRRVDRGESATFWVAPGGKLVVVGSAGSVEFLRLPSLETVWKSSLSGSVADAEFALGRVCLLTRDTRGKSELVTVGEEGQELTFTSMPGAKALEPFPAAKCVAVRTADGLVGLDPTSGSSLFSLPDAVDFCAVPPASSPLEFLTIDNASRSVTCWAYPSVSPVWQQSFSLDRPRETSRLSADRSFFFVHNSDQVERRVLGSGDIIDVFQLLSTGRIRHAVLSEDGGLVALDGGHGVEVFDVEHGRHVNTFSRRQGQRFEWVTAAARKCFWVWRSGELVQVSYSGYDLGPLVLLPIPVRFPEATRLLSIDNQSGFALIWDGAPESKILIRAVGAEGSLAEIDWSGSECKSGYLIQGERRGVVVTADNWICAVDFVESTVHRVAQLDMNIVEVAADSNSIVVGVSGELLALSWDGETKWRCPSPKGETLTAFAYDAASGRTFSGWSRGSLCVTTSDSDQPANVPLSTMDKVRSIAPLTRCVFVAVGGRVMRVTQRDVDLLVEYPGMICTAVAALSQPERVFVHWVDPATFQNFLEVYDTEGRLFRLNASVFNVKRTQLVLCKEQQSLVLWQENALNVWDARRRQVPSGE